MRNLNDLFAGDRWIAVTNVSGEEIPAFAPMRITGIDLTNEVKVDKPNAEGMPQVLINGQTPIPVDGVGQATYTFPAYVLHDAVDGSPVAGESWGTAAGEWKLRKHKAGFFACGTSSGDRPLFIASCCTCSGSGAGTVRVRVVTGICRATGGSGG